MSDRELLALAANAIGASITPLDCIWDDNQGEFVKWDPLTDDGDALRLAVKLKIDTKHYPDHVVCWYEDFFGTGKIFYEDNPCAATRRAIVCAAAEIGKLQLTSNVSS